MIKYDKIVETKILMAERLKILRGEHNLTQQHMANLLGVSKSVYSNWERCVRIPDGEMIRKLSHHFGVSADFLLGRSKLRNNITLQEKFVDRAKFLDMTVLCKNSRNALIDFYEYLLSKENVSDRSKLDEIYRNIEIFRDLERVRDIKESKK